jgi:hypothetical protein
MPTTPGSHTVNPDGFGSDEFMASMLTGTQFRINRYGSRPKQVDANNIDNRSRAEPDPARTSNNGVLRADNLEDPFARQVDDVDTDDLFDVDVGANVNAAASVTQCAVCLGTGFVGGYDPVNAARVVYDTQADWNGVMLDGSARPNAFNVGGAAMLRMTVPRGARQLLALKVWNNKEQVGGVEIQVQLNGEWVSFAQRLRQVATGAPVILRLNFAIGSTDQFTHLEVMYDLGMEPVLIGWNRMSYSEDFNKIDQLDDVSVIIPPNVPFTSLYDVITEPVWKRTWKVSSTSNAPDRNLKVNGSESTVRVLQPMELVNLLPKLQTSQYWRGQQIVQTRRPDAGEQRANPYQLDQTGPKR